MCRSVGLQTAAVAWHVTSLAVFILVSLFALAHPVLWGVTIPYALYYFIDKSPGNGKVVRRYSLWFRSLPIWDYYCAYFPIKLIKTTDLPPTFTKGVATGPRYIFGYHPHGVGALGAFGAFATEGCHWSRLYSGIRVSLLTLVTQFHIPVYRDYLMALGIASVSRRSALKLLRRNQSICIVVGGAMESLLSNVGSTSLVLQKRKGFIKLALETGNVSLVPCFAFGETDCYNIICPRDDSFLQKLQLWIKGNYGFTIPLFYARGLFNYDVGLIPFRTPINIVVGRPIHVAQRVHNPSADLVNNYHTLYVKELQRIYNEYRAEYGLPDKELDIAG